ncbi:acyltransferase [Aminiphilus circumscriptus]|uniref:acyltransferase n=1 Tax=Aminiphilus circumscriptus TaxID=290732 RepID=UPI003B8486CC
MGAEVLSSDQTAPFPLVFRIYTHDSIQWAVSGGKANYDYAPVRIGNNCYIGPNTIIAKGVTIGNRCIIGARSLVLSDIPSGSKAYGTPCKVASSDGDKSAFLKNDAFIF